MLILLIIVLLIILYLIYPNYKIENYGEAARIQMYSQGPINSFLTVGKNKYPYNHYYPFINFGNQYNNKYSNCYNLTEKTLKEYEMEKNNDIVYYPFAETNKNGITLINNNYYPYPNSF